MSWYSGKEFSGPVARLSYGYQVFEQETKLYLSENKPFLGLFFNLENEFQYSFPCHKLPAGTIPKNHYTFMYVPEECCRYDLKKGTTTMFRLDFAIEFLKSFSPQFPVIEELLKCADRKTPYMVNIQPLIITDDLLAEITGIIHCPYIKGTRDAFLYTKVFDILLLSLEQLTVIKGVKGFFKPKIREARNYILNHLHDSLTLSLLASEIDVDTRSLTRNFKKVYNTTVMNFIFEERMKKAVAYLRDSNKNISQIAAAIGYKSISNFTDAFTRKFGYPPSTLRKGSPEDEE